MRLSYGIHITGILFQSNNRGREFFAVFANDVDDIGKH